jgi:hypothetical protein
MCEMSSEPTVFIMLNFFTTLMAILLAITAAVTMTIAAMGPFCMVGSLFQKEFTILQSFGMLLATPVGLFASWLLLVIVRWLWFLF